MISKSAILKTQGIILIILVIFSYSCNPIYYVPTTQNVPLISSKGELNVNLGASAFGDHVFINGSYGISNQIGSLLNTSFVSNINTNTRIASSHFIEIGVGPYFNLTPWLSMDIYPVIGIGSINNKFNDDDFLSNIHGELKANYLRYGFQPSITFRHEALGLTFSSGFLQLKYYNIRGNLIDNGVDNVQFLRDRQSSTLIEPAVTLSFTLKTFRFKLQGLKSFNLNNSDLIGRDGFLSISFGFLIKKNQTVQADNLKIN